MSSFTPPASENPIQASKLDLSEPKKKAAGISAVIESAKHVMAETGWLRGAKVLTKLNQKGGIDCPGCAWPDPDDERSRLGEYCENGVKAIAEEATKKSLDAHFFSTHSIQEIASWDDYTIGKKGRLTQPMYLAEGANHYTPLPWEEAFAMIASKLKSLDDPNEAVFYTSGRTSNEAAFLYQLFVRKFGTNNLPDCSNMCHESSGRALSSTVGIGKGSVTLDDFYHTEVIFVIGQNPGTNHPRMLSALARAKENGAIIISVNPLKEAGLLAFDDPQKLSTIVGGSASLTDHYLQVRINGDQALFKCLNSLLVEIDTNEPGSTLDHKFISEKTNGFETYSKHLQEQDKIALAELAGIELDQIKKIAHLLTHKSKIICCWAMGLTQHKNAVNTIKEVVNLLLLKGSIGKKGAGTCPVRGHSNVQGDRTMGIHERPPKRLLDALASRFDFSPPREHGYDVVEAIKAMHDGKAKLFLAMGGNFLSATPDTKYTAEALRNTALSVQISTKLNRSHLVTGREALILPCLGRTEKDIQSKQEQFVSVENSMGVVHSSSGVLPPVSALLKSEVRIISDLAEAVFGSDDAVEWQKMADDYDRIRDAIEDCIPGFEQYNQRVREPGGFYLPNGARKGVFMTPSSKAEFTTEECAITQASSGQFIMMTIRSHDQFNTTIYGLDDRYRGIKKERRVVLISKADMASLGLKKEQVVDLENEHNGIKRIARTFTIVPYDIPHGCIATYFPEANVLVPIDSVADESNTPASKSIIVRIIPS